MKFLKKHTTSKIVIFSLVVGIFSSESSFGTVRYFCLQNDTFTSVKIINALPDRGTVIDNWDTSALVINDENDQEYTLPAAKDASVMDNFVNKG